jgi:type II secretory pathway pseudopilin PulG
LKPETEARARGFTLIEAAVAVFIIALLLGSILVPLTTQVEQRQVGDTQKTLDEIRDALVGFAAAKGYLPCPDTGADGLENANAGTGRCAVFVGGIAAGRLPHVDLGLGSSDVWGNRFTYLVSEPFAQRSPATPFSLSTVGTNIRICTAQACATTLSTTAIAAVVSHGRNGFGATNLSTGAQNPASPSLDEQDNYGADADLVSRPRLTGGAPASEFDDIVMWLSRHTLFNRMVAAGRLP